MDEACLVLGQDASFEPSLSRGAMGSLCPTIASHQSLSGYLVPRCGAGSLPTCSPVPPTTSATCHCTHLCDGAQAATLRPAGFCVAATAFPSKRRAAVLGLKHEERWAEMR